MKTKVRYIRGYLNPLGEGGRSTFKQLDIGQRSILPLERRNKGAIYKLLENKISIKATLKKSKSIKGLVDVNAIGKRERKRYA